MTRPTWTTGQEVRRRRRAANLTQQQLATKAGLRSATISALENDHTNYAADTLDRVAVALGTSAESILSARDPARHTAPAESAHEAGDLESRHLRLADQLQQVVLVLSGVIAEIRDSVARAGYQTASGSGARHGHRG